MKENLKEGSLKDGLFSKSLIIIFGLLLALLFLTDIFLPDKIFSQSENRYLARKPEFTLSALLKGDFTSDYEKYIDDQFVLRDQWMLLKVRAEKALMKKENNATVFAKDGYLFNKYLKIGGSFERNSNLLLDFAKTYPDRKIYLGIAPNSYEILSDKVPRGLYNVNQKEYLEALGSNLVFLDFYQALAAQKDQYIYYKTDHHWTIDGAWYAYESFCKEAGLEAVKKDLARDCVDDFRGTFYLSSDKSEARKDKLCWYPDLDAPVIIDGVEKDSLYDFSYLKGRDKYAIFLHNNPGMGLIKSDQPSLSGKDKRGRILIFKDSYANSFIPFLTENYEEILVLDLRYFNGSIAEIMAEGWEEVLFLFNFISFADDPYLLKIKV